MRAAEAFALGSSLVWSIFAALSTPYDLRGLAYIAPAVLALWGWRELRAGNTTRAALLLAATLFGLPATFSSGAREGRSGGEKRIEARPPRWEDKPLKPLSPPPPPPRVQTMPGDGRELVFVPSWVLEAVDLFFS